MGEGEQPIASEPDKSSIVKYKEKRERNRLSTKIVCRRLPPNMTEESFLEQVSPIPEHDYFYFTKPDSSLAPDLFCRVYINFLNMDDIYLFRDRFDDYIFLDDKGNEYPAIVEYAPFQRMPKKKRKKDPKCGTLETDPTYLEFLESLKEIDSDAREPKMEYCYQPTEEKKETNTPLLDYLAARKKEERRRREERQQRRRPRARNSKDDENYEEEFKKIKPRENDDKTDPVEFDDDYYVETETKDVQFQGKGRLKNYKDGKHSSDDHRKKPDYNRKDKDGDHIDDEKNNRREKKDRLTYKERNKEKFYDKKEKGKYSDRKLEKKAEDKDNKVSEKKVFSISVKSKAPDKVTGIAKSTAMLSSKIKPFTTLPQLKVEELSKVIDEMDINSKKDANTSNKKEDESTSVEPTESKKSDEKVFKKPFENDKSLSTAKTDNEQRRNSLETKEREKDCSENVLKRHKSLDEKSQSDHSDRSKENDPRTERRIKNKDRPSLAIYQPGMGKFSKQRLEREKDKGGDGKNMASLHSSSNSVNSQE